MSTLIRTSGLLAALFSCASSVRATDYLIVGGGTAGLTLANRLTEDPSVSVLVLEAGGDGLGNVNISDIALIGAAWGTQVDWQFPIEPFPNPPGRNIGIVPRGKVLGGSSAINGDVWSRGDVRDYAQWQGLGNPSWGSDAVLNASFKSEHFFAPPSNWSIDYISSDHGDTGPLPTSFDAPAPPIHEALIESVVNYGGVRSPDNEGGHVDGISWATNARLPSNATRATSATGYYFPYSYRKNFQVKLFSQATRIIWNSTSQGNAVAAGVEYVDQQGNTQVANATTVVLAGGVWGSPPILERSGVGNKTLLTSLGINSVVDLPGVGENMQEQPVGVMEFVLNSSLPLGVLTPFLLNLESLQQTFAKDGDINTLNSLFVKPDNMPEALFQTYQALYQEQAAWFEGNINFATSGTQPTVLAWFAGLGRPLSRGTCHITSTNGTALPAVQYNWLTAEFDLYAMAVACQRIQNFASTPPLSNWIAGRLAPPANVTTIEEFEAFILETAFQGNHPIGTAAMMPQADGGVVDNNLKVYGTSNVFVVDASVMPIPTSSHPQANVYAIAERAAELFKASGHV
ncbi:hypothetical protein K488DRAFT_85067 [Vararia minispora EC-137]|uniref:Uncharacterized protein n=1 Tax=Vararia minispora EC-137 TaxID=1314806 RepID=A0ACB8QN75_9AGAM|nr:hypothetical protein K488DRAFT_85067 [Vararia minispora EC-137]